MLTAGQELAVLADPPDSRRGTHLSAESVIQQCQEAKSGGRKGSFQQEQPVWTPLTQMAMLPSMLEFTTVDLSTHYFPSWHLNRSRSVSICCVSSERPLHFSKPALVLVDTSRL